MTRTKELLLQSLRDDFTAAAQASAAVRKTPKEKRERWLEDRLSEAQKLAEAIKRGEQELRDNRASLTAIPFEKAVEAAVKKLDGAAKTMVKGLPAAITGRTGSAGLRAM